MEEEGGCGGPGGLSPLVAPSPAGRLLSFAGLHFFALLAVFLGAQNSLRRPRGKFLTDRDAVFYPLYSSCVLIVIYLFIPTGLFKNVWQMLPAVFQRTVCEIFYLLYTIYFFFIGIWRLSYVISPLVDKYFPDHFPIPGYIPVLIFISQSMLKVFDTKDVMSLAISSIVGVWYMQRKHWLANNLFGLVFAFVGIERLCLKNVRTGCILLGCFAIEDVIWVFGTNVMVSVASFLDGPHKLLFPRDLLENRGFTMLGLGDVVIPGSFIALLLRFDISLKKKSHRYFYTGVVGYSFGLSLAFFFSHFRKSQPALLYLVPSCISFPLLMALVNGEVAEMLSYPTNIKSKKVPRRSLPSLPRRNAVSPSNGTENKRKRRTELELLTQTILGQLPPSPTASDLAF